ncbi:MAG: hypothetical protein Q9199_000823 [Rusavskia elegans]
MPSGVRRKYVDGTPIETTKAKKTLIQLRTYATIPQDGPQALAHTRASMMAIVPRVIDGLARKQRDIMSVDPSALGNHKCYCWPALEHLCRVGLTVILGTFIRIFRTKETTKLVWRGLDPWAEAARASAIAILRRIGIHENIRDTTHFIILNAARLDSTYQGRTLIPQPPWTVASWLQERKKLFPTAARKAENEERLKTEPREQKQDSKLQRSLQEQRKTLEQPDDQALGKVKREAAAAKVDLTD